MLNIDTVGQADLADLLPMLRAYCDFYRVDPPDDRSDGARRPALIDDPDEGVQLIARGADGTPLGFATIYWTWQTLYACSSRRAQRPVRGAGVARIRAPVVR